MYKKILKALNTIEKDYQVSILYACESGSRAWGFASQNSDFDVRFIYVFRSVLAVIYLERGLGQIPMEFSKLIAAVVEDNKLHNSINNLLSLKKAGQE